jgi:hypothetical protein
VVLADALTTPGMSQKGSDVDREMARLEAEIRRLEVEYDI